MPAPCSQTTSTEEHRSEAITPETVQDSSISNACQAEARGGEMSLEGRCPSMKLGERGLGGAIVLGDMNLNEPSLL